MGGRAIAGKYKLSRKIGQGGMGSVWEATDQVLQRAVAVKLIDKDTHESKSARARFHREAMALAQLRNAHIVQVYDYGIDEGAPFMVMELLEGEDFEQRLRRDKHLEASIVVNIARQVARGLMAAAVHGIVHRDLKPANLYLSASAGGEFVKVLDFGVASMRSIADPDSDKIVGTPIYMSPEQLGGSPPSPLWDLWALAVISYRGFTGKLPFRGDRLPTLIESICTDPFDPPSSLVAALPATLDAFFSRALSKDPRERFQSAADFIGALTQAATGATMITILSVDDEPDIAQLMTIRFRKQIRKSQYKFIFAHNGEEALEKLRYHPEIDVVLSDINMPVMDGLTLLGKIPEVATHVPTVMVSAYGDMANIRRAMNEGAFDFVVKPLDFKDLEATIVKAKRAADGNRARVSSDSDLRSLRKLTSARVQQRLAQHEPVMALADEAAEGTVAVVRIVGLEREQSSSYARRLNANYEIVIPEIRKRGGAVENIERDRLTAVWSGPDHLERALDACAAMFDGLIELTTLPDEAAPDFGRLAVGVSTGQLFMSCIGSRVCGRLSYMSLGPAVDEAQKLALSSDQAAILVSEQVRLQWGNRSFRFEETEFAEMNATSVYEMKWNSESDVQAVLEHGNSLASMVTDEGEFGQTMLSQTMAGKLDRNSPVGGA